jgi:hypothetical protein
MHRRGAGRAVLCGAPRGVEDLNSREDRSGGWARCWREKRASGKKRSPPLL